MTPRALPPVPTRCHLTRTQSPNPGLTPARPLRPPRKPGVQLELTDAVPSTAQTRVRPGTNARDERRLLPDPTPRADSQPGPKQPSTGPQARSPLPSPDSALPPQGQAPGRVLGPAGEHPRAQGRLRLPPPVLQVPAEVSAARLLAHPPCPSGRPGDTSAPSPAPRTPPQVRHPHSRDVAALAGRRTSGRPASASGRQHGPGPVPDGGHQGLRQEPRVGEWGDGEEGRRAEREIGKEKGGKRLGEIRIK